MYVFLFAVTVLTAGGSILYLSYVAHTSDTKVASEYPAPSLSVAYDSAIGAINLVDHGVFSRSTTSPFVPDMWRTPGHPFFVAPFYAIFGNFYPVLIAQVFILFLTVILIFKMAKRVIGQKWALVLSVLYLFLPTTMLSTSALLNENLFVFVFVIALYIFFFSELKNIYVRWAFTGFLFALTVYIRPASMYFLLFFIPAYFAFYMPWSEFSRKYIFAALIMIAAFLGTLAPWCVRNKIEFDSWQFASTGPFFLFRQNATQFYEGYNGISNLEARYALEDMAGIPRGPVPSDPKYSAVMQKVALEVIFAHPFRYAIWHLSTFIPFFTSSGANDYWVFVNNMGPNYNRPPEPSLIQALHPFKFSVLIIVLKNHGWTLLENIAWCLIALLVLIGLWRSKNIQLARIFFAIVLYFAFVTGPGAHARYRVPVEPLLLISAFSAASYLWEKRTRTISISTGKTESSK